MKECRTHSYAIQNNIGSYLTVMVWLVFAFIHENEGNHNKTSDIYVWTMNLEISEIFWRDKVYENKLYLCACWWPCAIKKHAHILL